MQSEPTVELACAPSFLRDATRVIAQPSQLHLIGVMITNACLTMGAPTDGGGFTGQSFTNLQSMLVMPSQRACSGAPMSSVDLNLVAPGPGDE